MTIREICCSKDHRYKNWLANTLMSKNVYVSHFWKNSLWDGNPVSPFDPIPDAWGSGAAAWRKCPNMFASSVVSL